MQSLCRVQVEFRQSLGRVYRGQVDSKQSIGRVQVEARQSLCRVQVQSKQSLGRVQVQSLGRAMAEFRYRLQVEYRQSPDRVQVQSRQSLCRVQVGCWQCLGRVQVESMQSLGMVSIVSRQQWRIQRGFNGFYGTPLLKGCLRKYYAQTYSHWSYALQLQSSNNA